jgi:hypothetical protein
MGTVTALDSPPTDNVLRQCSEIDDEEAKVLLGYDS